MMTSESTRVIQDIKQALVVLKNVGQWMLDSGMNPSKWWHPDNMNQDFFAQYTEPKEFYVAMVDETPAAAQVIQSDQRNQDWSAVDGEKSLSAVYIHWLCVDRKFSGMGLPELMIDFAQDLARFQGHKRVRVDTNASEEKLRSIYESLGFELIGTQDEEYRTTAFYQKDC